MKKITWKIKDTWKSTKASYPGEYTDYCFGWLTFSKLFPGTSRFLGFHLDIPGKTYSICNFKKIEWGTWKGNKSFYLRIDLYFGGWFFTFCRPNPQQYESVEIVSIV